MGRLTFFQQWKGNAALELTWNFERNAK